MAGVELLSNSPIAAGNHVLQPKHCRTREIRASVRSRQRPHLFATAWIPSFCLFLTRPESRFTPTPHHLVSRSRVSPLSRFLFPSLVPRRGGNPFLSFPMNFENRVFCLNDLTKGIDCPESNYSQQQQQQDLVDPTILSGWTQLLSCVLLCHSLLCCMAGAIIIRNVVYGRSKNKIRKRKKNTEVHAGSLCHMEATLHV